MIKEENIQYLSIEDTVEHLRRLVEVMDKEMEHKDQKYE